MEKGILIVFEGIDGAGKSTQVELLLKRLCSEGYDAVGFREPSDSRWGRKIKEKARHPGSLTPREELDLFLMDRRENVRENVKPALAAGKIVILDRYYYSTMAYQGSKGMDPEKIRKMNEEFAPKPDLVFILDIDAPRGLDRIKDRERKDRLFEQEDYLCRVRDIFKSLEGEEFIRLDASLPAEDLGGIIARKTLDHLRNFRS